MMQQMIEQVSAFIERDKFSKQAWLERGLNPSAPEVIAAMDGLMNRAASALRDALYASGTPEAIHELLQAELNWIDSSDFDTEEREFICDLFYQLAQIVGIDFSKELHEWLYGHLTPSFEGHIPVHGGKTPVEIIAHFCPGCNSQLKALILSRDKEIPDSVWNMVSCNHCKGLSLFDLGTGVKEFGFEGCALHEQLPKSMFGLQQAEQLIEQLRQLK